MPQTDLSSRRGHPADLAAISAIEAAVFEPSRRSSRRALVRALASPFQRVLVLEERANLAGFVIVWPYRHTWRVYNLATHPDYRGRGAATMLLAEVAAQARAAGASRLVLECLPGELEAYYQRRGFGVRQRLADYYAPGEDAVRMEMSLSGS